MGDTIAQTRFENVSKLSNDLLLARGNTLQSDEDRLKLKKIMELCTNLQQRVLDLEKIKTSQHNEIVSLKRRVKKLEKKNRSRTHKLKRLRKIGATARVESFCDEESLDDADKEMFDVNDLAGEEVFVAEKEVVINVVEEVVEAINTAKLIVDAAQVSTASATTTISVATTTTDDLTLAQALQELKITKPKVKGIVFREPAKVDDVQETAKVDDDQEAAKIKELIEVILDEEEVTIDAIPLATKPLSIVDWKIHKEVKKIYYQIIRADGSSKMYLVFSQLFKSFDREDLETLWKLVKAKHGSTRPKEGYDRVI
ncbi:hypothetical protein Tco_0881192 [Tanacetum coccineum]